MQKVTLAKTIKTKKICQYFFKINQINQNQIKKSGLKRKKHTFAAKLGLKLILI